MKSTSKDYSTPCYSKWEWPRIFLLGIKRPKEQKNAYAHLNKMHEQQQDMRVNFISEVVSKTDICASDNVLGKGVEEM